MNNGVKLETIDGKCEKCGNNLKYSPNDGALKCEKCGAKETIEFSSNNAKMPYNDVNDGALVAWLQEQKYIKCKSCGSTIELKNNEISIDCPYCDSQNIVVEKEIKGLYPSSIVRFAFDKTQASINFQKQVKKKFMAPRSFKKLLPENEIEGFYFPAFSFDADTSSTYRGVLYRYETHGTGDNRHTTVVRFNIKGDLDFKHRDVLVESSSRLTQFELKSLLPFDFSLKADFKPEYMLGYIVEQYNEPFRNAVSKSAEICKEQIRNAILSKYSYDGVDKLDVQSIYSNKCYAYCMMPVYTFEFMYKDKKYITYMNGQTGKVGSGLPISKVKVAFGIILSVLIVLIPILLVLFLGE